MWKGKNFCGVVIYDIRSPRIRLCRFLQKSIKAKIRILINLSRVYCRQDHHSKVDKEFRRSKIVVFNKKMDSTTLRA